MTRCSMLPPTWHARRHSGQLLANFTSDVGQVETALTQALQAGTRDGLQLVALLVACATLDVSSSPSRSWGARRRPALSTASRGP